MPEYSTVTITDSGDKLKVVWDGSDGGFDPYFIFKGTMMNVAASLRESLAKLVKHGRDKGFAATGEILHEISLKGYELYTGLFTDAGESVQDPDAVRRWLDTRPPGRMINFRVNGPIHIPWGLAFHHDPSDYAPDPNATGIAQYQDFWAFRYSTSTVYFRINANAISQAWPVDSFKILSVRNREAFEAALAKLNDADRQLLEQFDQTSAMVLYTKKDLLKQWADLSSKVGLLYFYCHANETTLALAEEDSLTVDEFLLRMPRSGAKSPCLVFLNGCSTAVGDPKGGFLSATGRPGYAGFIGTETKVPTVFAMRFGLAFLYLFLYKGLAVGAAMDHLRRDHWPLSLVYGPYCPATLQVAPNDAFQVPEFPAGNFCMDELGQGQL